MNKIFTAAIDGIKAEGKDELAFSLITRLCSKQFGGR